MNIAGKLQHTFYRVSAACCRYITKSLAPIFFASDVFTFKSTKNSKFVGFKLIFGSKICQHDVLRTREPRCIACIHSSAVFHWIFASFILEISCVNQWIFRHSLFTRIPSQVTHGSVYSFVQSWSMILTPYISMTLM